MTIEQATRRMRLVSGTVDTAIAESQDLVRFGDLIEAAVPDDWPPEILRDAQAFFLALYRDHPDWTGWLHWYGIRVDAAAPTLCGSVGFMGPPDARGMVEIGYSVLPAYQGDGVATEMVGGLVDWALRQTGVRCIEAETTPDNVGSVRVLERTGFRTIGAGGEPGSVRYRSEASTTAAQLGGAPGVPSDHG